MNKSLNEASKREGVAKYLVVLSVISALLLLVSLPIMMFLFMGMGLSPGAPHMSYPELLFFAVCPVLILVIQAVIIRARQFSGVALIFNMFAAIMASVELFVVVGVKAAG